MRRFIVFAAVVMTGISLPAASLGADSKSAELTPAETARLRGLIQQLGDRSFKVREHAASQIVAYGRLAAPFLREAQNNSAAEIRTRSARLLPIAMQHDLEKIIKSFLDDKDGKQSAGLAGWGRFKEVAGNDETARQLFVDLHRVDNDLLEQIDSDPAGAATKVNARCQEFMQARNFGQAVGTTTQVAVMLFAVLNPKLKLDANSQNMFSSGLYTMSFQQRGKDMLKENSAVRRMLVQYILTGSQTVNYQNMYLVANLELKEGVDIAKKFLKGSERDPYTRSMALAILGKIGSRSEIPEVLPFLDNTSSVGSVQFGNGVNINTQMRDVALATLVQVSGLNMADYDFAYLKAFNNNMGRVNLNFALSPGMLGFSDDATRLASIKKWKVWYEGEKKRK
jgi:HEAT repeat protein